MSDPHESAARIYRESARIQHAVSGLAGWALDLRRALVLVLGELEGELGHDPGVGCPRDTLTKGQAYARECLGLGPNDPLDGVLLE